MRLSTISYLALSAELATAYLNTSPFFLFSTSSKFTALPVNQIQESSRVYSEILRDLESCPTKHYVIISQAGVSTSDYTKSHTPTLASLQRNPDTKSSIVVSEVLGDIEVQDIKDTLVQKCKVQLTTDKKSNFDKPTLVEINFPVVTKSSQLKKNDAHLASLLKKLPKDYTLIYTTSVPVEDATQYQYQMEEPLFDIPHSDLKRDLSFHKRQSNQTLVDGPLFDKYQFFTPGIWMGFTVTLLLLGILYVGVNALASLQVTYAAFEKESGPGSNKKAQ